MKTTKSDQQEYYNFSKNIKLDSKRDQVYYEDVADSINNKVSPSQVSKNKEKIKTTKNIVYGVSNTQNPKKNLHSREEGVIRKEDELYDAAKHQVSLSRDKIKMNQNMVYGLNKSSDGGMNTQKKLLENTKGEVKGEGHVIGENTQDDKISPSLDYSYVTNI